MIKNLINTARKGTLICVLAVLFASGAFARPDSALTQLEDRINDLIYRVSRSVVTVEAIQPRTFGASGVPGREAVHTLVSSGLIYDTLGHVVVAASSVQNRERILIHCDNHTLEARLLGVDYPSGLALLATDTRFGTPVCFRKNPHCAGQMVIALGNAYGVRASPSIGFCAGFRSDGLMQFTAPITSGTIGGGVFDLSGNLVGLITGGIGDRQWAEVGLAVPINEIPTIVTYLRDHGDRYAGYIGIRIADFEVSPGLEINYPARLVNSGRTPGRIVDRGIMITDVSAGSPAARAGLMAGDVLFSINGVAVGSAVELRELVRDNPPGTRVEVGFIRHDMPYVVQLDIARSDDTRFNDALLLDMSSGDADNLAGRIEGIRTGATVDSLRQEVERLKRALQSLEQRLR